MSNSGFYVGQKVAAIKDHSQKVFIKDQKFTVLSVFSCPGCGRQTIGIGIHTPHEMMRCGYTGKRFPNIDSFYASNFAPVIDDSREYAEKLLNEITIEINEEISVEV